MKILFLSSLDPNNINSWSGTLYFIFNSLKKRHLLFWRGKDIIDKVKHYHYVQAGKKSRFFPEFYAETLCKSVSIIVSKKNFDIIIARDYYFISHLKLNIPIVYIGDTTFDLFKKYLNISGTPFEFLAEKIETKAISHSDMIIYSSEWAKENAMKHYSAEENKIKVIEFGANLEEKRIPIKDSFPQMDICNLLFIGKNWHFKGGEKAYQTYLILKKKGLNCSLTIVGCNPEHLNTEDPHLYIIPFINKSIEEEKSQMDEIFKHTHFFILPTLFDCFGIVFCEASAYGIPSLTTDIGGVNQAVKNGKNGYLFSQDADPLQYAQLIIQLWNDNKIYRKLRISSRQEFETRLNWVVWEKKINTFFNELNKNYNKMKQCSQELEFYIPTYVVNLKERKDRKNHIINEFKGKNEFNVKFIEGCRHPIGAVGLWETIVKIVNMAINQDDDVILICEDDHYFTENYSKEYFFENILSAYEQGADILSGGIGGFGYAVPISRNRYWVNWFWCTQFIVIYKKFYQKILDYDFKENDTADGVISKLSNNIMTLYPFISQQREFGYSDITQGNKDNPHLITEHFEQSNTRLLAIHNVSTFYNYPDIF